MKAASTSSTGSGRQTDFVVERFFPVDPEAVFQAWADPQAKRAWSDCHAEYTTGYQLDFRVHGHETHRVDYPDGRVQEIEKVYFDITANRRIIFSYDLRMDAQLVSVSLVTLDFFAEPGGTRMVYAEQLSYVDGQEGHELRVQGTREGLDRLGLSLHVGGKPS